MERIAQAWRDVAEARQRIIDQLKAEKAALRHEVERLHRKGLT